MSENRVREDATYDENTESVESEGSDATVTIPAQHADARPPGPRGPSASTVVFGLMLAVAATLLLGHELDLFDVDPVTSAVLLLMGSGALLVIWALISMVGRRGGSD
jgi:hypothetical protein